MQMPLADDFTPGREVLIDLVQIPPNTSLDRHWHPGEEFHYYLEGEVEIKIDGAPSIIGTPGTVGHVPFKKWHVAVAGAKGAKIVVFRVHTKGEPWRYADK
jgi:quercetin dioxygenase-like cupin family protein